MRSDITEEVIARIMQASDAELEPLLKAVLQRYAEVFPDWVVSTISYCKSEDKNQQLDSAIRLLEHMKELDD